MSTEQLKALRDAALVVHGEKASADFVAVCDRAIASLSEQPKPCATIPLPESASELPHCSCGYTGWPTPSCSGCGKPLSAEAHQQPAPADVPPMPQVLAFEETVDGPDFGCAEDAVRALHAACVRIAQRNAELEAECAHWNEVQRETQDELAEAHRESEAERAGRPGSINAMTITSLRERLAEAEAELAALKGQEPLFWVEDMTEDNEHNPFDRYRIAFDGSQCPTAFAVYAAPVAAPDSVPREQHEAALVQARRDGLREALALVERDMKRAAAMGAINAVWPALNEAADGIRALAEKGGKVGK